MGPGCGTIPVSIDRAGMKTRSVTKNGTCPADLGGGSGRRHPKFRLPCPRPRANLFCLKTCSPRSTRLCQSSKTFNSCDAGSRKSGMRAGSKRFMSCFLPMRSRGDKGARKRKFAGQRNSYGSCMTSVARPGYPGHRRGHLRRGRQGGHALVRRHDTYGSCSRIPSNRSNGAEPRHDDRAHC